MLEDLIRLFMSAFGLEGPDRKTSDDSAPHEDADPPAADGGEPPPVLEAESLEEALGRLANDLDATIDLLHARAAS